jgi:hypothetical protein
MAIIVGNGPALKVFWNDMRRRNWTWPSALPRLKVVWKDNKDDKPETERQQISSKAPRLSTVQTSRFQVSRIMPEAHLTSQTETLSTLRSSKHGDYHYSEEWKDKRRGTYYNENDV